RAGLGDHTRLAHPLGEQRLPQHIVDLVGAGVVEILTFQPHPGTTGMFGEPGRFGQQRRTARVTRQQPVELIGERRILACLLVFGRQLVQRPDQRFRHEPPPVGAEVPPGIRLMVATLVRPHGPHRLGRGQAGWDPAVTNCVSAALGSSVVTRPPPTSTASAPCPAYAIRSPGPRTPDSAILVTSIGSPGAKRENTSRSTSNVCRSRAFTPRTLAPASSARSASSALCTSTSAVMPSDSTRSSRAVNAFWSRAATINRTMSAPCSRASCTWYGLTTKSLRSTGISTAARTASRSAREPLNRRGSVNTLIARAPASA